MESPKVISSFAENFFNFGNGLKLAFNLLLDNLGTILVIIFIGLITALVARNVNRFMENYVKAMSGKLHIDITSLQMFRHIVVAIIYFIGILIVIFSIPSLQNLSVALFTGAGIVGIIIGFAAQNTLSNMIAGISIAIFQPFRVGDRLDILTEYGKVVDLNLRHTVIVTWDNRRLIIPNSKIGNEAIINWTIEDPAVIWSIDVGISYDANIDKARKIMIEEARKHPNVMPPNEVLYSGISPKLNRPKSHNIGALDKSVFHIIDPDFRERGGVKVQVTELKEYSMNLRLQVWFHDRNIARSSECEIREAIIKRFFEEGIEIPYPYRTIIFKPVNEKKEKDIKAIEKKSKSIEDFTLT
jgi:small-conductance mechanosensitive channel